MAILNKKKNGCINCLHQWINYIYILIWNSSIMKWKLPGLDSSVIGMDGDWKLKSGKSHNHFVYNLYNIIGLCTSNKLLIELLY
jgi:hypothetical protein